MLAANPDVFSFPETHYFRKIRGRFGNEAGWLASPRPAWRQVKALAADLRGHDADLSRWRLGVSARAYGRAFANIVDTACFGANKKAWVEKSPVHLHFIEEIAAAVPGARFVHILRNGGSAVASFYGICLATPEWVQQVLPGDPRENLRRDQHDYRVLDAVVDRWNRDVAISRRYAGRPGHVLTTHERLTANPREELARLCLSLGLLFNEEMLDYRAAAERVIGWRIDHPHMQGPLQELRHPAGSRLELVLSVEGIRRVQSRLSFRGDAERAILSVWPDAFVGGRAA